MQNAGVEVLEVTTPDTHDRRKRGKNDDLDAQNAAHAAFAGRRTVTPKSRDGMLESLRVLKACRKTAVAARRVALQMIHNTIVCAPDDLRETLRKMTRMQLIRTLAAWRPDLTDYRSVGSAYRITLKSLGRRYLRIQRGRKRRHHRGHRHQHHRDADQPDQQRRPAITEPDGQTEMQRIQHHR
jgi:transposase